MPVPYYLLLVDKDEDDILFFCSAAAERQVPIPVTVVKDSIQLLDRLQELPEEEMPAAIIFDYHLLRNGSELLEWLNAHRYFNRVPKFIWSAYDNQRTIDTCKEMGAAAYLLKTADIKDINAVIDQIALLSGTGNL